MQTSTKFLFSLAVIVVLSNPCVGSSPRANIYFFLLSVYNAELKSIPKIISLIPQSKPGYEKGEQESNQIPYPEKESLSGSRFLFKLTVSKKQSFESTFAVLRQFLAAETLLKQ